MTDRLNEYLNNQPRNGDDPLISPLAAAMRLGVTPETVYRWIRRKEIPSEPKGPFRRVVRLSDVDAKAAPGQSFAPSDSLPAETPARDLGGLYFVSGSGLVKIGMSRRILSRFSAIKASSPVPVRLAAVVLCDRVEAKRLEGELHQRFSAYRRHGEWFAESEEVVSYIQGNAVAWPRVKIL